MEFIFYQMIMPLIIFILLGFILFSQYLRKGGKLIIRNLKPEECE